MLFGDREKQHIETIREMVASIEKSHKDYINLGMRYSKLQDAYILLGKDYLKTMNFITDYMMRGADEKFLLLFKEHNMDERAKITEDKELSDDFRI